MPRIVFPLAADLEVLRIALTALVEINLVQMARSPLPSLYAAGVRYRREGRGREVWQTARQVARKRRADCEDLAAYRAAELVHTGEDPGAIADLIDGGRPGLIHAVVVRGDGSIEDPSRILGMGRP